MLQSNHYFDNYNFPFCLLYVNNRQSVVIRMHQQLLLHFDLRKFGFQIGGVTSDFKKNIPRCRLSCMRGRSYGSQRAWQNRRRIQEESQRDRSFLIC